jgi:hypothetical protein
MYPSGEGGPSTKRVEEEIFKLIAWYILKQSNDLNF